MADELEESRPTEGPRMQGDPEHLRKCHARWQTRGHRATERGANYREEWYREQCGGCRWFVRLTGAFFDDWGVCSSEHSPADGQAVSEHDGCASFSPADEDWDYPTKMT
jgi:hypothetical protein